MDTPIQFQIHTGSAEPIYRQLMDQLRRRVAAGQWTAGQELPSVRELALQLAVHPMTISKAYGLLEIEGLLERRRGLPMVIAAGHARLERSRLRSEFGIAERLERGLERVDARDGLAVALEQALVAAAENLLEEVWEHRSLLKGCRGRPGWPETP